MPEPVKLVAFNQAEPTSDQRRSSNWGVRIFSVLLCMPWAAAIIAVLAMCLGLFAGMLDGFQGKVFGIIAALCVAGGLAALPVVSAYAAAKKEPAISILAGLFALACLYYAGLAAYGFGSVLGFDYPQIAQKTKTVRFDDEPGQIRSIEARIDYWLETSRPYREDNGRPIKAAGREILNMTYDCSRPRQAFERSQCDEFFYLQAEKRARLECENGERIRNCGKTRLTVASISEAPGPFSKAQLARGKLHSAVSVPAIAVVVTAFWGIISLWILDQLINVKQEIQTDQPPEEDAKPPVEEVIDHYERWRMDCVKADGSNDPINASDILENYKHWCNKAGLLRPLLSDQLFYKRFAGDFRAHKDHSNDSIYRGLKLKKLV